MWNMVSFLPWAPQVSWVDLSVHASIRVLTNIYSTVLAHEFVSPTRR